jgi:PKD repeat protein
MDTSTDFPTTWNWTFGDGNTSTLQNPSFTYTTAGSYTVTLTVTNALGSDVSSETGYISVSASATAPVASFSGDPSAGTAPLSVEFTDTSTNSPTTWTWDFGDGGTSTSEEPTHTYTAAGSYTVSLTAANNAGSNVSVQKNTIDVSAAPAAQSTFAPVSTPTSAPALSKVSFTGTPTSGAAPLTVQFTAKSTGTPALWAWDFGDGGTSTEQDPSYTYTIPGTYTVTLTAKYPEYDIPSAQTDYITVNGGSASSQAPLPPVTAIGAIAIVVIFSAVISGRKKQ